MASAAEELRRLAHKVRRIADEYKAGKQALSAKAWGEAAELIEAALAAADNGVEAADGSNPEPAADLASSPAVAAVGRLLGGGAGEAGLGAASELLRAGRILAAFEAITANPAIMGDLKAELPGRPVEVYGPLTLETFEDFALGLRGGRSRPGAPRPEPRPAGRSIRPPRVERVLGPAADPLGNPPGSFVSCRGCGAPNPAGLMVRGTNGYFCDACAAKAMSACAACGNTEGLTLIRSSDRYLCTLCIENGEPSPPRKCPECGLARSVFRRFKPGGGELCDVCFDEYSRNLGRTVAEAADGDPGEAGEREEKKTDGERGESGDDDR